MRKIRAWMQLGVERRETVIEIPDEEYAAGRRLGPDLEVWIEELVLEWIRNTYGWGWSGEGYVNDFGFLEHDRPTSGVCTVADSAEPNTVAIRLGVTMGALRGQTTH